ncbi:NAD-dependent epimerase/dehydratase family protein [Streptococcus sp. S784/96/1]|uniref:NAD-dependent epimerase/dehydratase family protein n=1 Tax=Streptococcus sp. S784/96/1 TaxID=2653499 RepID=UPI00138A48FF|nr:NAD-dependent epimerase/dehydratase family protein [Streptococcus sp. S784/96/1]
MKRILITGANSYVGTSFENYANTNFASEFEIFTLDLLDSQWRKTDFSNFDVVFHVAGLAHADIGQVTESIKQKYYDVNTKLAIEVAEIAKRAKVKHFIFMSSMIIYGESAPIGQKKIIDEKTKPQPANFYGDSKLQADIGIRSLADDQFQVAILRPPMIYGEGSKGNFPLLIKLSKSLRVFPKINNQRSMLFIENLCEFLCQIILKEKSGIFFPQNAEYANTSDIVKILALSYGRKIKLLPCLNPMVKLIAIFPGKIGKMVNKAFGNMTYELTSSQYEGIEYQKVSLEESLQKNKNYGN